jgi:hypothetical protein
MHHARAGSGFALNDKNVLLNHPAWLREQRGRRHCSK